MTSTRTLGRRSARVAVTLLAGAGVVLAGATAASAASYDSNGDGYVDHYQFDSNADGYVDFWAYDLNQDGRSDELILDVDFNTTPDYWVVDRDNDAYWEQLLVDTNGDWYPDTLVPGYVYDTVWGPNTVLSGPAVIGGGGSSSTGMAEIDAMNAATNQRIIDIWLAPACNSSYNGCA